LWPAEPGDELGDSERDPRGEQANQHTADSTSRVKDSFHRDYS